MLARQAATQQGIDWKALSHAVRIGRQAIELFTVGHYTFPLPYADEILAIKQGRLTYQAVSAEIEDLLDRVEAVALTSNLPDEPDRAWIDDFVVRVYGAAVAEGYNERNYDGFD